MTSATATATRRGPLAVQGALEHPSDATAATRAPAVAPAPHAHDQLGAPSATATAAPLAPTATPASPTSARVVSMRRPRAAVDQASSAGAKVDERTLATAAQVRFALHQHAQLVLDAVAADPAQLPFDGRLFPRDVADAVLRLEIGLHAVEQDLESGKLDRRTLAAARAKAGSDTQALIDLALAKLDARSVDLDRGLEALRRDPLWSASPLTLTVDGRRAAVDFELVGGAVNKFFHRSAASVVNAALNPEGAAEALLEHPLGRGLVAATKRYAEASALDRNPAEAERARVRGFVELAALCHAGREVPQNSTPAIIALALVTGSEPPASDADAMRLVEAYWKHRDAGTLVGVAPGASGDPVRRALDAMAGPRGAGARTLLDRLHREEAGLAKRRTWSDRLDLVGMSVLSMTAAGAVGARALTLAKAGHLSGVGVQVAATTAGFGAFTVPMQLKQRGELTWQATAHDAAMFAMLAGVGRLASGWASKLPPGKVQVAATHAAMIGATSTALTSVDLVMNEELRNWPAAKERFLHNLETVAILHGVSSGLARLRPDLDTGAQVRAEHERLSAEAAQLQQRVTSTAISVRQVLDRAAEVTDLPRNHPRRAEVAQQLASLLERLDSSARQSEQLAAKFTRFSGREARGELANLETRSLAELERAVLGNTQSLQFEAALLRHLARNVTTNATAAEPVPRAEMARFIFETWQHVRDQSKLEGAIHVEKQGSYLPARQLPREVTLRALEARLATESGPRRAQLEKLAGELRASNAEWAPSFTARKLHDLLGNDFAALSEHIQASVPRGLLERAVERVLRERNEDAVVTFQEMGDLAAPFRRAARENKADPLLREWDASRVHGQQTWVRLSPAAMKRLREVAHREVDNVVPRSWLEDMLSPEVLSGKVLAQAKQDPAIDLAGLRAELAQAKAEGRDWVVGRSGADAIARLVWGQMPKSRAHDWDEPAPLALVKLEVRKAREAGETVPAEVLSLIQRAEASGQLHLQVGKGEELVLRDLANTKNTGGVAGWGLRLHRLALHHNASGSVASAADLVNALRQRRGYKEPMSFAEIEAYFIMLRRTQQIDQPTYNVLLAARFTQERLELAGEAWSY